MYATSLTWRCASKHVMQQCCCKRRHVPLQHTPTTACIPDHQLVLPQHYHILCIASCRVLNVWYFDHTPGASPDAYAPPRPTSDMFKPWMRPLFQLQVLLLAKMQWDERHGPSRASQHPDALPAKALARALRQMVSPCVAGDLLQQRAPGLVPHGYKTRAPVVVRSTGQVLEGVVEQPFDIIAARDFSDMLIVPCRPLRACLQDGLLFDAMGEHCATLIIVVSTPVAVGPTPLPLHMHPSHAVSAGFILSAHSAVHPLCNEAEVGVFARIPTPGVIAMPLLGGSHQQSHSTCPSLTTALLQQGSWTWRC
jgi:hypothetical protein